MSGSRIVMWIGGIVVVALLVAVIAFGFERKTIDVTLPPRGEAVYNPMYALKLALLHEGQRVQARPHLLDAAHPLQANDTVVLLADPARWSRRESDAIEAFLKRGGHAIVQDSGALVGAQSDLLARVGVGRHVDSDYDCLTTMASSKKGEEGERNPNVVLCYDRFTLLPDARPTFAWGDHHGTAYARFAQGAGTLDVVAALDAVRNDRLTNSPADAALVRQLLQPHWGRGTFHLIYASEIPPLWRLLFDNAWRVLIVFAIGLLAWLWMRMQRFGPRLPSAPDARRSLLEHVQATGDHLYRYGRAHLLHAALRAHVLARLRRKDAVAAALEGTAQADAIAARTGLPAQDIADALRSPRPYDAKDFRHRIARLIDLGRHI